VSTALLELAAACIGGLAEEVVFLGGATIGLRVSDPAAPAVRATEDVDVVLAATYIELDAFASRLRGRGFREDREVICRYRHPCGLVLDVMPVDSRVVGFGNRWYADAVAQAQTVTLPSGATIRAVRPPWLLATKLEAYRGRGGEDPIASPDFEDVVRLIDGPGELSAEIAAAPEPLRRYIAGELAGLAARPDFTEELAAALPPDAGTQSRIGLVAERWEAIVAAADGRG
jgi:hypothetical protein